MLADKIKILVFIRNLLVNKDTCLKRVIEMVHVSSLMMRYKSCLIFEYKAIELKKIVAVYLKVDKRKNSLMFLFEISISLLRKTS